ncbi:uncharacterized protein EKO05_0011093 [Ascochyta rabiei]|uniref:Uncharacterized protein n=1 Tax=Didymella rabiei TaxID=5454 RepID=A0A162ZD38_DIDRA|nr:uncharacterized protein EKO05_0011093 [Ascochyta rabiei]KZM20540.1 hypothetical protein ST47_g8305 [Ascochyta rabiei]UPX20879.1 hypothetical protein EKO05_0011093 [Ascochyta rabiei]
MLFTTVAALLFPVTILAVPAQKPAAGDDKCTPVSYILSDYTLTRSPSFAFVSFNIESAFTVDSPYDDAVESGANCEADGADLGNDNECNIAGERTDKLVFDVKGSTGDASYRITHNWKCNNATWASVNDIQLPPLDCNAIEDGKDGETVTCHSKPIIFTPQNIRKLSSKDSKKTAGKAKGVATMPTAKPSDCPSC